jgi:hypothetical protein
VSPLTTELLIWTTFGLSASIIPGLLIYSEVQEQRWRTRPQDLKTFAKMQRAFRIGSKTKPSDRRRHSAVSAMRQFVEQGASPAERETIALMMRDAIAEVLRERDNRTANDVREMLETLAAAAPAWEADFVEQVSRSKLEAWVRGEAIERLTRLRGLASLDVLLRLADDPPVAPAAAASIATLGRAAATPEVLSRLRRMLGETDWAPPAAARALIALGHAADPGLAAHMDKFDPWTRFVMRVKAAGLNAPALIERLFAAGIIDEASRKSAKRSMTSKMQKALDAGDGFKAVEGFLRRMSAVYSFDTEWNPVPDYGELLKWLSWLASPRLTITDIDVQSDGEVCREVTCKVAGHPARFAPQFNDDWTDLEAVLGGLNGALAAAGRPERFADLRAFSQVAHVVVGRADGLANLVETLGLPLHSNETTPIVIQSAAADRAARQI